MANRKRKYDLTIREIEYSILIKEKDKGFHKLREILCSELTRFEDTQKKSERAWNPIHDFLKTNIETSTIIRESTKIYFIDYREQDSFTIQFTLLVITGYINYGTTRQALDYLIKDTIGDYFEELLERHIPVKVSVHSVDNEIYEINGNKQNVNSIKPRLQHDYLSVFLASLALLFTVTMSLIWFLHKNQANEIKKPSVDYRDKYFELLIEKQINEAFAKEKLNFILYKNLVSTSDTGTNIKFQEKK